MIATLFMYMSVQQYVKKWLLIFCNKLNSQVCISVQIQEQERRQVDTVRFVFVQLYL